MRFKDKVTIVTGGAQGLGKAIAEGFGREGAHVIILDILEKEAKSVVGEIEHKGGKAVAIGLDATKGQEVKSAIGNIVEKWGRIDILVNNIGGNEVIPFLESDESIWQKSLDLNFLVTLRFCHTVLPYMVNQKHGVIVNIASVAGRQPRPMSLVYSAAKAGVIAMTRTLAVAMAPHNIRVNSVSPGTMDNRSRAQRPPEHFEPILRQVSLGRMSKPEEVAAAVLFLASDEASYIVGQSLHVDGGNCML